MAKKIMKYRKMMRDAKMKQKASIKSQAAKSRLKQKKLVEKRLNILRLNRIKPHDPPHKLDLSEEESSNMSDARQTRDEVSSELTAEQTENWIDRTTTEHIDAVGDEMKPDSSVSKPLLEEQNNQRGKRWGKKNNKLRPAKLNDFSSASSSERALNRNFGKAKRKTIPDITQQSFAPEKSLASLSPPAITEDKPILFTRPKSGTDDLNSETGRSDLIKLANSRLSASKLNNSLSPGDKSNIVRFPADFFSKDKQKKAADLLEKSKYLPGFDRLEQRISGNVLERQAIEAVDDLSFNMMLFNLAKQVLLDDKCLSQMDKEEKHRITKRKSGKRGRKSEWLTALRVILESQDDNASKERTKPHRLNEHANRYEKKLCPLMPEDLKLRQNDPSDSVDSGNSGSSLNSNTDDDNEAHRFRDLKRLCEVIRLFQAPKNPAKKSHQCKNTSAVNSAELPNPHMIAYPRDLHDCIPLVAYPIDEPRVNVYMCTSVPNYYYVPSDISTNFTNPAAACNNTLFAPNLTEVEMVYFPEFYYC